MLFFFQIKFFIKKKSQEYYQSVNQFWIQLRSARQNVEPDLDPNCFQKVISRRHWHGKLSPELEAFCDRVLAISGFADT